MESVMGANRGRFASSMKYRYLANCGVHTSAQSHMVARWQIGAEGWGDEVFG